MKKKCRECLKEKPLKDFGRYLFENKYWYYVSYCKECNRKRLKEWKLQNKDKVLMQQGRRNAKIGLRWLGYIKIRCSRKDGSYYKKGIKNFLTPNEIEILWKRDKGELLKRPSIDRIDNDGNYEFDNCRFIELLENIKLSYKNKI